MKKEKWWKNAALQRKGEKILARGTRERRRRGVHSKVWLHSRLSGSDSDGLLILCFIPLLDLIAAFLPAWSNKQSPSTSEHFYSWKCKHGPPTPLTCQIEDNLMNRNVFVTVRGLGGCSGDRGRVGAFLSAAGSPESWWNAWSGNGNSERLETFLYGTIGYQRPQRATPCSLQMWPGQQQVREQLLQRFLHTVCQSREPAWSFTTWVERSSAVPQHESCGRWHEMVASICSQIFCFIFNF